MSWWIDNICIWSYKYIAWCKFGFCKAWNYPAWIWLLWWMLCALSNLILLGEGDSIHNLSQITHQIHTIGANKEFHKLSFWGSLFQSAFDTKRPTYGTQCRKQLCKFAICHLSCLVAPKISVWFRTVLERPDSSCLPVHLCCFICIGNYGILHYSCHFK